LLLALLQPTVLPGVLATVIVADQTSMGSVFG